MRNGMETFKNLNIIDKTMDNKEADVGLIALCKTENNLYLIKR